MYCEAKIKHEVWLKIYERRVICNVAYEENVGTKMNE